MSSDDILKMIGHRPVYRVASAASRCGSGSPSASDATLQNDAKTSSASITQDSLAALNPSRVGAKASMNRA